MTGLEDAFGDEFASHIQERTAERRQERNRLTEEQMAKVAHLAINEGKFEEGDPQFVFTSENGVTHSILLAQVPDPENSEVWQHLSEPWDGAAKLPLDYLGQWYWSVFPDKKDVADLEQGDWVIVAGSIEESETDNGDISYSIYPVRGVLTLGEAKEYAEGFQGDSDFEAEEEDDPDEDFVESEDTTEDEQETTQEDDTTESETDDSGSDDGGLDFNSGSDDSGGGLDGLMGDEGEDDDDEDEEKVSEDDRAVPYEEIAATVEELAESQDPEEEPQVFEIEEGSEHHKRITQVVANNLGLDDMEGTGEVVIDVIEEHRDDEEEEDDTNKLF